MIISTRFSYVPQLSNLSTNQSITHTLSPTRHKLDAKLSTLKLHLSDEKLEMLADFFRHVPVPRSYSMMGLDDSIDGHLDPVLSIVVREEHYIVCALVRNLSEKYGFR